MGCTHPVPAASDLPANRSKPLCRGSSQGECQKIVAGEPGPAATGGLDLDGTVARSSGMGAVADLLEQTLREEKATDEKLTALAEGEINPAALQQAA